MKTLKKIESTKVDLNPNSKLSQEDMQNLTGGGGCICYKNGFGIVICPENGGQPFCACWHNPFGFCTVVNGGGSPENPSKVTDTTLQS